MPKLPQIIARHSDNIDAVVSEFTGQLERVIKKAQATLLDELAARLQLGPGNVVVATAGNRRILRGLDEMMASALKRAGYQDLLTGYVKSFDGQFTFFNDVLAAISDDLKFPLPAVTFDAHDGVEFEAIKIGTRDLLNDVLIKTADAAKRQALLSVGAINTKQLAAEIGHQFGNTVSESENLAMTSIASFYRTITDKGFRIIEEDLPGFKVRYRYEGPLDKLTRPFCIKLEKQSRGGKTWARKEIDQLANGQIPNVFISGGGYRCRHQWLIDVNLIRQQQETKGQPEPKGQRPMTRERVQQNIQARRVVIAERLQNQVPRLTSQLVAAARLEALQAVQARRRAP